MSFEETEIYRAGEKLTTHMEGMEGILTIPEAFETVCSKYGNKILYKWRNCEKQHILHTLSTNKKFVTYEHGGAKTLTYNQTLEMVKALTVGILRFDPSLKAHERVGIYLHTCVEWGLSLLAINRACLTVTSLYTTLGWEPLIEVINEAELTTIVTSGDRVTALDDHIGEENKCPTLKNLIVVGECPNLKCRNFKVMSIYDVMKDGFENLKDAIYERPKPEDIACMCYTSGSTGSPKGVMTMHKSLIACAASYSERMRLTPEDVHLSYLPFAHMYELGVHFSMLFSGVEIVFASPRTLFVRPGGEKRLGCLEFARPTIMVGVPRIWEVIRKHIYNRIRKEGSEMEVYMFDMMMARKIEVLQKDRKNVKVLYDEDTTHTPLENVVFEKAREMLGGRLRIVCSGGAPLKPDTQYFFQAILGTDGAQVVQEYGLTETCCGLMASLDQNEDYRVQHCGVPLGCVEVKLRSVPEMNYSVKTLPCPQGELLMRGPSMLTGYYKKPEKTREALDEDGWFYTGDVVQINDNGTISYIDRKKNLVKLQHGEYVAVEVVELKYAECPFLAANGIYLHVDSTRDYVVAILIPDHTRAVEFAESIGLQSKEVDDIIKGLAFYKAVEESLMEIAKKEGLKGYEVLNMNRFIIKNDVWTPQGGELTTTSKLKRNFLREKYALEISKMYRDILRTPIVKKKSVFEGEEDVVVKPPPPEFFREIQPICLRELEGKE